MKQIPAGIRKAILRVVDTPIYSWQRKGKKITIYAYNRKVPVVVTLKKSEIEEMATE